MTQKSDTSGAAGETSGTVDQGGPHKSPGVGFSLTSVVSALAAVQDEITHTRSTRSRRSNLPSRQALIDIVEALRSALFPGFFGESDLREESLPYHLGSTLDWVAGALEEQVKRGLCASGELACERESAPGDKATCEARAREVAEAFMGTLPELRRKLSTDVRAHYEGDPAATSYAEIILSYPGLRCITDHRIAHELYRLDVPFIPRIISEHAHGLTGIDIHPGAQIDDYFFIDHGTGVVIGETCVIGKRVRIYQGVTLGAKSFPLDEHGNPIKGIARHPIVEDDVIIYSGATVLGRNVIGKGSVIGGNVWLTKGVPPGSFVSQGQPRPTRFADGDGI